MPLQYTYLLINFLTIIICLVFSFHKKIRFDQYFLSFIKASLLVAIPFVIWDVYFTLAGVWWFNANYVVGLNLLGLPLEEILFFICIPFSCVYTYHCLKHFGILKGRRLGDSRILILAATVLFVAACLNYHRVYTMVAFISTTLVLLYLIRYCSSETRSRINNVFLILLFPFLIVNGVLTGSGLSSPIVNYNPQEILNIRIFTIPLEDAIYAYELIALNIVLFEHFRSRRPGALS